MSRTTRKEVEALFVQLANALDRSDMSLDFYGAAGGYRIMASDGHVPFGHRRRVAGEMASTIRFALDVLHFDGERDREEDRRSYAQGVSDCAEHWPYYDQLLS